MNERGQGFRLAVTALLLLAAFAGLGARLTTLHVGGDGRLRERAELAHQVEFVRPAMRGAVCDARGVPVALDRPVFDVCADPSVISREGTAALIGRRLAETLALEPAEVIAKLSRTNQYVRLARWVEEDRLAPLKKPKLANVWFEPVYRRYYPQDQLACHVLGFANAEGDGGAGLELRYNRWMKGQAGLCASERDAQGRELLQRRWLEIPPVPGAQVQLTLDANLQHMVEDALDRAMITNHAAAAWAVLQRIKTGEILAMASRPGFNLNEYGQAETSALLNRAIGYTYEPGSTFKMATIAGALDAGVVTPETMFDCENGAWFYQGRLLHDYHPYGRLALMDVIKKSSNIGAAKTALLLGEARTETYLRAFGIGSATGVELPGEEGGILHPRDEWTPLSLTRIAMGHEVACTALQVLQVLCTLANDGVRMRPAIIRRIVDAKGRTLEEFQPQVVARPVRPETARLMLRLLTRATEEGGTGRAARFPGYTVAGKTGTAQKIVGGQYSSASNVASFVGAVPAEAPEVALIVVVDEPQPLHTGGQVAAPVFAEIMREAVRYLDLPPSEPEAAVGSSAREAGHVARTALR